MSRLAILFLLGVLTLTGCAARTEPIVNRESDQARTDVRIRWAKQHIQLGEYEEAKRPLTQALEISPRSPDVLNLLAFVFQQQGETALAEQYFKEALAADPTFAPGQNNYGIFLMIQKRYQEACAHLNTAAKNPLYEGRPQALENLAGCYLLSGESALAEATYRQVLRLNPDSVTANIELASLAYERGDSGEAWSRFSRFSELVNLRRTEHTAKSLWLGVQLARDGRDPGMAATYALLLKNLYPDSPEYMRYKESRQ